MAHFVQQGSGSVLKFIGLTSHYLNDFPAKHQHFTNNTEGGNANLTLMRLEEFEDDLIKLKYFERVIVNRV